MKISQLCMVILWFECFEYYPYIQMWQYILIYGVGAKPVTHLMQYHLLQWEVAKVKPLMNSSMTLPVLNLLQKTPKGATTKIQVKRYGRYKREKIALDMQDQRSNPCQTMTFVVGREKLFIGSAVSQTHSPLITHGYKHKSNSLTS